MAGAVTVKDLEFYVDGVLRSAEPDIELFNSSSQAEARHLDADQGGTLGVTAVLHTWGQNLSLHPLLHCVVSGAALARDGRSVVSPRTRGFLFPVRALSKVFRAKFLEALQQAFKRGKFGDDTAVPALCSALRKIDWVVYAKPPFAGPESVLAYLGAYTHRIAISNHRIVSLEGRRVSFLYRDYADEAADRKKKVMCLDVDEFIRRFLLHLLPKGFVRIRHYGLLANRSRKQKIARCRALLSAPEPEERTEETLAQKLLRLAGVDLQGCPVCHEGRMLVVAEIDRRRGGLVRVEVCDSS